MEPKHQLKKSLTIALHGLPLRKFKKQTNKQNKKKQKKLSRKIIVASFIGLLKLDLNEQKSFQKLTLFTNNLLEKFRIGESEYFYFKVSIKDIYNVTQNIVLISFYEL